MLKASAVAVVFGLAIMLKPLVITIGAVLILSGIEGARAESVKVTDDQYRPKVNFEIEGGQTKFSGGASGWSLVCTVERTSRARDCGIVWWQIYTDRHWRYWSSAGTDKGENLNVGPPRRTVESCGRYTGCLYSETLVIVLPNATIEATRRQTMSIKIFAQSGDTDVIYVSKDMANSIVQEMNNRFAPAGQGGAKKPAK